jgi:hypothetical protein
LSAVEPHAHPRAFTNALSKQKWKALALLALLIAVPITTGQAMAYDEPSYKVLHSSGYGLKSLQKKIELRKYDSMLVAEVDVEASGWQSAANQAFRPLANFIFGSNDRNENIGMTIPVTTHSTPSGKWRVSFVMPDGYSDKTLPTPNTSSIEVSTREPVHMASIRFSGRIRGTAGERNFRKAEEKLRAALDSAEISPAGQAFYAVYNGPFTPSLFRRNEVLIPIHNSVGSPQKWAEQ